MRAQPEYIPPGPGTPHHLAGDDQSGPDDQPGGLPAGQAGEGRGGGVRGGEDQAGPPGLPSEDRAILSPA